jgi:uncharacterized protein (DUF1697 family)
VRFVALLRGINLGARNRLAMADLRRLLEELGYADVRTHLQSGNAVFTAPTRSARQVERDVEGALSAHGLPVRVLVRTAAQVRDVVAADPLGDRADDPARYMVIFLEKPVSKAALDGLDPGKYEPEVLVASGKHLYLWLPRGTHASRLPALLSEQRLGGATTMRNWRTVTALAEMARG